ncbi:MAG: glycosyltransferase family 2 protein [Bacteroidota bacterium]|nr:glycosyltransferase family 2 protein [Bacteroidota bacterium]
MPTVTLLIPAYNEIDFIEAKIKNCASLNYPSDRLEVIFVTDGSTDGTPEYIQTHSHYKVMHIPTRAGKIAAMNRAMLQVSSDITIFCDANTTLNKNAIKNLVNHFANPEVGCVAGEKKVGIESNSQASATEGIYWKYESFLKKMDSELLSVVGAAGELFAIRTALYQPMPSDVILDDFVISLKLAMEGYKVSYEPKAFAFEKPSSGINEELKRKIRISAGGIQAIIMLSPLLNMFKYGLLSFQYISHRVLRWTITPVCLLILFPLNGLLMNNHGGVYSFLFLMQFLFYAIAYVGWYLQMHNVKFKVLYVPMYFTMMNYAVFKGIVKFVNGNQSAIWEKSLRMG